MGKLAAKDLRPPKGLLLWAFKAPVWLYRAGLGWLLGKRMIYIEHIGRKSGQVRRSVVEVVRNDEDSGAIYVVSGYGEKADWYKNIIKTPRVIAKMGTRRFSADVKRLPVEDALAEFKSYFKRNPMAAKMVGRLLGLPLQGTEEEMVELSQLLPVLEITLIHGSLKDVENEYWK